MTDTACPSCDAPAVPGARRCSRCGYAFFEDGGPTARPRLPRIGTSAAVAAAMLVVAVAAVLLASGGNGDQGKARVDHAPVAHLEVLSAHPLARRNAERLLERRYFPIPDDDESDVHCSGRVPRPAHSVRRCEVRYPGGTERSVVVLTNANGSEVLSKP